MTYKTLVDLWPKPEYKSDPESVEQERARLNAGGIFELVERTDYQRAFRVRGEDIRVQGTHTDWLLTVQSNCSLGEAIAALKQVAFYAIKGVRIPEPLSDHFAKAVDSMALAYESDVSIGVDDAATAQKCLNVLGRKLGILAGHRRPKVSFRLVGYMYDRIFDQAWQENFDKVIAAEKEGILSPEEISAMDDDVMDDADFVAKEGVKYLFQLSDQQLSRYLEKHTHWKDWGGAPPEESSDN